MKKVKDFLYKDLSYKIRGCAFAVLLLVLGLGLLVGCSSICAAEPLRSGVQVSPLSIEREIWPGEEFFFAVKFFNPLDYPQNVRPKFKDFVIEEQGKVQFLDYSSRRYTVSRWANFKKEVIELGPHEEITLEVGIKVPEDAATGGHFGAFFGVVRGEGEVEAEGPYRVGHNVAAGALVFLSVLGEGVGDDDWIGDLSDFSVEGKKFGGVFLSSEPISFRTIFVNKGIFHQNVWGGLGVFDIFGKAAEGFRLREKKVLPETYVAYSQPWKPDFPVGKYEARLEFLYGRNGEKEVTRSVSFWVVDPRVSLAVIGLGSVVSVFAIVKRRKRTP